MIKSRPDKYCNNISYKEKRKNTNLESIARENEVKDQAKDKELKPFQTSIKVALFHFLLQHHHSEILATPLISLVCNVSLEF